MDSYSDGPISDYAKSQGHTRGSQNFSEHTMEQLFQYLGDLDRMLDDTVENRVAVLEEINKRQNQYSNAIKVSNKHYYSLTNRDATPEEGDANDVDWETAKQEKIIRGRY